MGNDAAESVGSMMSKRVPVCRRTDLRDDIMAILTDKQWNNEHNIYVLDTDKHLLGIIPIAKVLQADRRAKAYHLMHNAYETLHVDDDPEKAVFMAIRDDITAIPVVNHNNKFVGAVTSHSLINAMHNEHVEDGLLTAGIRGRASHVAKLASERTFLIVQSRAPWLLFGLFVGLGLGLISSFFEEALQANVAIAYFIPVVAYIADSVGTQSEAIVVRALATLKLNYSLYLLKELFVGLMLGVMIGALGGLGAAFIAQSPQIGVVVAVSLFIACTFAAVLAALIPILFKKMGKDPALGSGPLATALQDVLSIVVYFSVAMLILPA